ncbi:hypothetical protein Btru_025056 [Bulinus truncatus]|nr:hypothetical protein Btru_025056 [Bulinus truncatus]
MKVINTILLVLWLPYQTFTFKSFILNCSPKEKDFNLEVWKSYYKWGKCNAHRLLKSVGERVFPKDEDIAWDVWREHDPSLSSQDRQMFHFVIAGIKDMSLVEWKDRFDFVQHRSNLTEAVWELVYTETKYRIRVNTEERKKYRRLVQSFENLEMGKWKNVYKFRNYRDNSTTTELLQYLLVRLGTLDFTSASKGLYQEFRHLGDFVMSYCPYRCREGQMVSINNLDSTCPAKRCQPCSCLMPECQTYGVCCPDITDSFFHYTGLVYEVKPIAELLNINPVRKTRDGSRYGSPVYRSPGKIVCETTENNETFLSVGSCDSHLSWNASIISQCEDDIHLDNVTVDNYLWVEDVERNVVYHNMYCARCNQARNPKKVSYTISFDKHLKVSINYNDNDNLRTALRLNQLGLATVRRDFPSNVTKFSCKEPHSRHKAIGLSPYLETFHSLKCWTIGTLYFKLVESMLNKGTSQLEFDCLNENMKELKQKELIPSTSVIITYYNPIRYTWTSLGTKHSSFASVHLNHKNCDVYGMVSKTLKLMVLPSVGQCVGEYRTVSDSVGQCCSVLVSVGQCVGEYRTVSDSVGQCWSVLVSVVQCVGEYRTVSDSVGQCWSVLVSVSMSIGQCRTVSDSVGQCWSALVSVSCVGEYRTVSDSVGQCWSVLVSVGKCVGEYRTVSDSVGQCWSVLVSVGQCVGEYRTVSDSVGQCWSALVSVSVSIRQCRTVLVSVLVSVGQCWPVLVSVGQCVGEYRTVSDSVGQCCVGQCWSVLVSVGQCVGEYRTVSDSVGQCWSVLVSVGQCVGEYRTVSDSVGQYWSVCRVGQCVGEYRTVSDSVGQCCSVLVSVGQCVSEYRTVSDSVGQCWSVLVSVVQCVGEYRTVSDSVGQCWSVLVSVSVSIGQCRTVLASVGQRWSVCRVGQCVGEYRTVSDSVGQCCSVLVSVGQCVSEYRTVSDSVGQCWSVLVSVAQCWSVLVSVLINIKCTSSKPFVHYGLKMWMLPRKGKITLDKKSGLLMNVFTQKIIELISYQNKSFKLTTGHLSTRDTRLNSQSSRELITLWFVSLIYNVSCEDAKHFQSYMLSKFMDNDIEVKVSGHSISFTGQHMMEPMQNIHYCNVSQTSITCTEHAFCSINPGTIGAPSKCPNLSADKEFSRFGNDQNESVIIIDLAMTLTCNYISFNRSNFNITMNMTSEPPRLSVTVDFDDFNIEFWEISDVNMMSLDDDDTLKVCYELLDEGVHQLRLSMWTIHILTFICVGCSILCLLITLITYVCFRSLRTAAGENHMFLSLSLLLAQCVLLVRSYSPTELYLCVGVGVTSHFLWLWMFTWTFICCYHIVRTFASTSKYTGWSVTKKVIASLVFPTSVVSAVIIGSYSTSGSSGYSLSYCYLDTFMLVEIALIGPMVVVNLANLTCFIITVCHIQRVRQMQSFRKDKRSMFWNYVKLSSLTGLFWTLDIVAETQDSDILSPKEKDFNLEVWKSYYKWGKCNAHRLLKSVGERVFPKDEDIASFAWDVWREQDPSLSSQDRQKFHFVIAGIKDMSLVEWRDRFDFVQHRSNLTELTWERVYTEAKNRIRVDTEERKKYRRLVKSFENLEIGKWKNVYQFRNYSDHFTTTELLQYLLVRLGTLDFTSVDGDQYAGFTDLTSVDGGSNNNTLKGFRRLVWDYFGTFAMSYCPYRCRDGQVVSINNLDSTCPVKRCQPCSCLMPECLTYGVCCPDIGDDNSELPGLAYEVKPIADLLNINPVRKTHYSSKYQLPKYESITKIVCETTENNETFLSVGSCDSHLSWNASIVSQCEDDNLL